LGRTAQTWRRRKSRPRPWGGCRWGGSAKWAHRRWSRPATRSLRVLLVRRVLQTRTSLGLKKVSFLAFDSKKKKIPILMDPQLDRLSLARVTSTLAPKTFTLHCSRSSGVSLLTANEVACQSEGEKPALPWLTTTRTFPGWLVKSRRTLSSVSPLL